MRKFAVLAVLSVVAVSAFAQSVRSGRQAPNVLFLDQAATAFIIPVAGNAPGELGTHWRSHIVISNFRSAEQRIRVTTLPAAGSGVSSTTREFTLPAYENGGDLGLVDQDFVGTRLSTTGLMALRVEAITASGAADSQARIDGISRIYTPAPNGGPGTLSMAMSTVKTDHLSGSQFSAFAVGMQQDANYRTNAGIVNLSGATQTYRVDIFGSSTDATMNVSVPANSLAQFSLPDGNFGTATVTFTMTGGSGNWTAYAASVDNRSGDSWARNANY